MSAITTHPVHPKILRMKSLKKKANVGLNRTLTQVSAHLQAPQWLSQNIYAYLIAYRSVNWFPGIQLAISLCSPFPKYLKIKHKFGDFIGR